MLEKDPINIFPNDLPNANEPNADVVVFQQETLSPIVTAYFGSSIKLHDISMGFQSPKLGTGGDAASTSPASGVQTEIRRGGTALATFAVQGPVYIGANGTFILYRPKH